MAQKKKKGVYISVFLFMWAREKDDGRWDRLAKQASAGWRGAFLSFFIFFYIVVHTFISIRANWNALAYMCSMFLPFRQQGNGRAEPKYSRRVNSVCIHIYLFQTKYTPTQCIIIIIIIIIVIRYLVVPLYKRRAKTKQKRFISLWLLFDRHLIDSKKKFFFSKSASVSYRIAV